MIRCITALALCSGHLSAQSAVIVAGTGVGGYSGDGSAATAAQLYVPSSVFATAAGDLYIADTANSRIRHISAAGQIRTISGTGQRVYSQDGQPAGETGLMSPVSVVADGAGSVYLAEWTGNRVRKIDPSGTVSTIAGNGESGYVGESLQATETSLWTPSRIFLDGKGNLYIAEWNAHRVRIVRPDGKITTVAGNGKPGFAGDEGPATEASLDRPNGLFVTERGEIYISDLGNNRVRRVDAKGTIRTVAGNGEPKYRGDGGAATDASLNAPCGIFVDSEGSLYISDSRNKKVRKVDPAGTITTHVHDFVFPDTQQLKRKPLRNPTDVFVDGAGNLYVSDGTMNGIIKVPAGAAPTSLKVSRDGAVGYERQVGVMEWIRGLF